jgi:uncharacterized protein
MHSWQTSAFKKFHTAAADIVPAMIRRLTSDDNHAVETLLETRPTVNLFLLGFMAVHQLNRAWWYGQFSRDAIRGVVMVLPNRLAVPWIPDVEDAKALGDHLYSLHPPCMLVGPRAACDGLWSNWAPGVVPDRCYDQRLYTLEKAPDVGLVSGFRRARALDSERVARFAAEMEFEDLGTQRATEDPDLHTMVVEERIKAGRTWLIERDGHIVFQVNVGTSTAWGCQIGGTYVPPAHRGKGFATIGVAALMDRLLAREKLVTLHVNEANRPAVRVYEKVGFAKAAPYRLITVGNEP